MIITTAVKDLSKSRNSLIFTSTSNDNSKTNIDTGLSLRRREREGYDRLDGVVLVMDWGGGTGEVIDLVDLEQDRLDDIVPDELEPGVAEQMNEVVLPAGEEVVHNDDIVAPSDQLVDEVASNETGAASDDDPGSASGDGCGDSADSFDGEVAE